MPEGNKSVKPDNPQVPFPEFVGNNFSRRGLEYSYTLPRNPIFGVRERYHYVNEPSEYAYVGHESFDLPASVVFNILISIDYDDVLKTALEDSGFGIIDVDLVRACFPSADEPNATSRAFWRPGLGESHTKTVLVEAYAEGSRVDEFEMRVKEKAVEGTTLKDAFIEVLSKSHAEFEDRARGLVEDRARDLVEDWMRRDGGSAASVEVGMHRVYAEPVCACISEILSRFRFSFNPALSVLDSKYQPFHGIIESEESLRDAITESCLTLFKAVAIFLTRIEALKVAIKRVRRVPKRSRAEAFAVIAEGHYDMMPSALYAYGGGRAIAEQFDDAVRWPTSVSDEWDAFVLLTDASNVAADLLYRYGSDSEEHRRLEDYMKGLVTLSYDLLFSTTRSHPFLVGAKKRSSPLDPLRLLGDFRSFLLEIGKIKSAAEIELIGNAFEFGNSGEGLRDRVFLSRTLEAKLGLSKRSFSVDYLDELLVVQALACLEGGYSVLADGKDGRLSFSLSKRR